MLFGEVIEFAVIIFILVVLGTQIVIPLLRGTPFFPVLGRERKLVEELSRAKEDVRHAELEEKIDATRRQADHIRQSGAAAPEDGQSETEGNNRSQSI